MRPAFGRYSEKLRVERKMTQTEFSKKTGMSLSRINNIENQRSNIGEDVVRCYLRVLQCTGDEALEIRKLAVFSNGLRKRSGPETTHPPLQVMLEQFGDRISPQSVAKIQQILETETGELVETLQFSSNQTSSKNSKIRTRRSRPSLTAKRLVEIALLAHSIRQTICKNTEKLDVGFLLQVLSVNDDNFDFTIVDRLPSYLEGAFACIVGDAEGHTILIEEKRFVSASKGVFFARHVICHEISHHFLHGEHLKSKNVAFFAPQELSKNASSMIGSPRQIEQVVDTLMEVEAECFATFLLVPWEAFLKGTACSYLASDFGEQPKEVERYARYFQNRAVINEFKSELWAMGQNRHPIFDNK